MRWIYDYGLVFSLPCSTVFWHTLDDNLIGVSVGSRIFQPLVVHTCLMQNRLTQVRFFACPLQFHNRGVYNRYILLREDDHGKELDHRQRAAKHLALFAAVFALLFLQTLYGMADLLIIGRFGTVADTTAVSVGSQVMHMLTVMLLGLAMGTTVCIGQAVGAGDRRRAGRFTGNTITLFLACHWCLR